MMKKRLFSVLLAIAMLLLLMTATACGDTKNGATMPPDTTPPETTPPATTPPATTPPVTTPPATTTPPVTTPPAPTSYQITFIVGDQTTVITVPHGEIPVYSGSTDKASSESADYTFAGWRPAIAPASADATYVASYTTVARQYTVTYKVGAETVKTESLAYGSTPTPPETHGGKNVFWLDVKKVTGETVISGETTVLDVKMARWAYDYALMGYSGNYDRDGNVEAEGSALLYLAIGECEDPQSGVIRDRILASVRNLIAGDREPGFNAGPNHSYPPVALALAVIRHTPTVWNELTATEQAKLDLIMEGFAISTAFVSDDDNYYKTGPALTGNFYKTWNPNHRLAMIVPIVGSVLYFSADGRDGAAYVNGVFENFDYDSYIAKFEEYGFTRAKYHWTAGGFTHTDGTYVPSSKELMMGGGAAYVAYDDNSDSNHANRTPLAALTDGGYGAGIKGNSYTYLGVGLDNIAGILMKLYENTYSGGYVISDSSTMAGGKDKDGKPLAYIADGSKSPVEGELGMMYEFKAGDGGGIRSSASYNTHNFASVVQSFAVMELLGKSFLGVQDPFFRLLWVGNTDLIYKNEIGYVNYSLGKVVGLKTDANYPYYLPWKAWWGEHYGDAIRLTRPIGYVLNGSTATGLVESFERSKAAQTIALPTPTHVIDGATFGGWFLDAAGTKTSDGKLKIENGTLTIGANYFGEILLYAVYTYPANVTPKPIVFHASSVLTLPTSLPNVVYDMGQAITVPLPTPTLSAGVTFLGWYLTEDFSGEPLGESLSLSAEQVAALDELHLYAKHNRVIYEQKPGLLESISKTEGTIDTTLAEDGSDFVTVTVPSGNSNIALDTGKKLVFETGAITFSFTISADNQNPPPSFAIRFRGSSNTSDFVGVSDGVVMLRRGQETVKIAELSTDPTTLTFVLRDNPDKTESKITMLVDAYVNGVLVAEDFGYNTSRGYYAKDMIRFYWLFSNTTGADYVRTMYVKGLVVYDGECLPEN